MIFISSIGLIFSLGVIASTLIYVDSSKPIIFQQVIEDQRNNNFFGSDSDIRIIVEQRINSPDINPDDLQNVITNSVTQTIKNTGLSGKLGNLSFSSRIEGYQILITEEFGDGEFLETDFYEVAFFELSELIKSELMSFANSGSSFATQSNEGFLLHLGYDDEFAPKLTSPSVDNQTVIREAYYGPPTSETPVNQSLTVTGVGIVTREKIFGGGDYRTDRYEESKFPNLAKYLGNDYPQNILFVNDLTELISTLNITSSGPFKEGPRLKIIGTMDLDLENIDVYTVDAEIEKFDQFRFQLETAFYNQNQNFVGEFYVDFPAQWILRNAKSTVDGIFIGIVLFAIPIVLVSLFVANYSFGLINKSLTRFIGIYKTRGLANYTLFLMLVIDFILILIVAIAASIILVGYPVGSLVLHTDAFLSFNAFPDAAIILAFDNLIQVLVLLGIIFGLMINFLRIKRLSKMTIAETANPVEKGEPYWKRHNLDILFFIGGLFGYWLIYETIINQNSGLLLFGPVIILLLPLMIFMPFLLVIGAIMIFARIFPIVLGKIGKVIWDETGNLLGFALKNVIRHRQASTRAVMLIGVLITFLVMFFVFPSTSIHHDYTRRAYQAGAEGVGISPSGSLYNATLINILESNYSEYFDFTNFAIIPISSNTLDGSIFAVNTTSFLPAATFPISPETSNSLESDMELLSENNSLPSLLLHRNQFVRHSVNIGDNISIRGPTSSQLFTVIDGFNYWPRLYLNSWDDRMLYGVMNLKPLLEENSSLDKSIFNVNSAEVGYYFNFKPGVNQSEVASWLTGNFSLGMTLFEEEHLKFTSNISFLVIIGQLNADILVSVVIGVTVLLMFAYMQLNERRKEIFTERALGMKLHQLSILFLVESIILLLSGLIIGNILGVGLSWMFGIFVTQGQTIPPLVLFFPWDLIIGTELFILILAFIGALIPAWIVTKQDISAAFAGE